MLSTSTDPRQQSTSDRGRFIPSAILAPVALALTFLALPIAGGAAAATASASTSSPHATAAKKHCRKGQRRKHHGHKIVCVKRHRHHKPVAQGPVPGQGPAFGPGPTRPADPAIPNTVPTPPTTTPLPVGPGVGAPPPGSMPSLPGLGSNPSSEQRSLKDVRWCDISAQTDAGYFQGNYCEDFSAYVNGQGPYYFFAFEWTFYPAPFGGGAAPHDYAMYYVWNGSSWVYYTEGFIS